MSDAHWMDEPPVLLTRRQWATLTWDQRAWRQRHSKVRIAYLQAIHERSYGIAASHRLELHMALLEQSRHK